jgi:hypothetical protein
LETSQSALLCSTPNWEDEEEEEYKRKPRSTQRMERGLKLMRRMRELV